MCLTLDGLPQKKTLTATWWPDTTECQNQATRSNDEITVSDTKWTRVKNIPALRQGIHATANGSEE